MSVLSQPINFSKNNKNDNESDDYRISGVPTATQWVPIKLNLGCIIQYTPTRRQRSDGRRLYVQIVRIYFERQTKE